MTTKITIQYNEFENYTFLITAISPKANELDRVFMGYPHHVMPDSKWIPLSRMQSCQHIVKIDDSLSAMKIHEGDRHREGDLWNV